MEKSNVTPLIPKEKNSETDSSLVSSLSPREIVSELDRYVVGQNKAKKAVAIALRNRWRRQALKGEMKNEILPKNILMIGPTGVGKTEISRRLSKLAEAPFVKVEATRFTEVGYVGRDVEQIIRDLLEIAIAMEKVKKRKEVFTKAQKLAEEKVLDALVGKKASLATRESFRKRLRDGDLDANEIEISVNDGGSMPSFEVPGMPGANIGMISYPDWSGGRNTGTYYFFPDSKIWEAIHKKEIVPRQKHQVKSNQKAIHNDPGYGKYINGSLNLSYGYFKEIPKQLKVDVVEGDLNLQTNLLTSLKNAPNDVEGDLYAGANYIETLEGGPEIVRGDYKIAYNKLKNLKGLAKKIGGNLHIEGNPLESLDGA